MAAGIPSLNVFGLHWRFEACMPYATQNYKCCPLLLSPTERCSRCQRHSCRNRCRFQGQVALQHLQPTCQTALGTLSRRWLLLPSEAQHKPRAASPPLFSADAAATRTWPTDHVFLKSLPRVNFFCYNINPA